METKYVCTLKINIESPEKCRECLSNNQNRKLKNKAAETAEEPGKSTVLLQETERSVIAVTVEATDQTEQTITETFATTSQSENVQSEENVVTISQAEDNVMETNMEPLSATTISEYEHELLQKFRTKMNKLR
ncbi:13588_t:CDS:2, partial [Racocetra fulgida]